jgi:hypothetical protein
MQPHERAWIQDLLEASPDFVRATEDKRRIIASTMTRYKDIPREAIGEAEFVEALHFDYDTGSTIRTVYNLTERRVTRIEALKSYPTPLSEEEIALATKLAIDRDDKTRELFLKSKEDKITVNALAPVIVDKTSNQFAKRIAILVFRPMEPPAEPVSVTVNLTDGSICSP